MTEALIYGVMVGLALALTGAGGVLAVPTLMLGMGMSLAQAVPVSLAAVGIAATIGTFDGLLRGLVRYRAALLMALGGVALAPAGITVGHQLPLQVFSLIFIVLLVYVGARILKQVLGRDTNSACKLPGKKSCLLSEDTGRFMWDRKCFLTFATLGGLSGLCSGMLGIGGGLIIVPGMRRQSDLALQSVIATALMVVALVALATVLQTLVRGHTISAQGWWFVTASCAGMFVGRFCAPLFPAAALQISFACMSFIAALLLLFKFLLPQTAW